MHKDTAAFVAKLKDTTGRKCCPVRTVDAFEAFMDVLDEARAEARDLRKQFRGVRNVEDDASLVGMLNEADEKLAAVEYRVAAMEKEARWLQDIMIEIRDSLPRIGAAAEGSMTNK